MDISANLYERRIKSSLNIMVKDGYSKSCQDSLVVWDDQSYGLEGFRG